MATVKGTTRSGFSFEVDSAIMDDMELVDALADANGKRPLAISEVVSKVFGDQKAALYDHLRTEDGRVPMTDVSAEVSDVLAALGDDGKN